MVEYVIASEFDNQFGTCIRQTYPKEFIDTSQNVLIDYMMPDGMHRNKRDQLYFRSFLPVPTESMDLEIDALNVAVGKVNFYELIGNQKQLFDEIEDSLPKTQDLIKGSPIPPKQMFFEISVSNKKFIKLIYSKAEQTKEKFLIIHESINFKKVDGKIYSMQSEDETIYVFEFENDEQGSLFAHTIHLLEYNLKIAKKLSLDNSMFYKHGWFMCVAYNRKEDRDDRGSLYRSITIFSSKLNYFERFIEIVDEGCQQFSELPPHNFWKEPQVLTSEGIVKSVFYQVNSLIQDADSSRFKIVDDLVLDFGDSNFSGTPLVSEDPTGKISKSQEDLQLPKTISFKPAPMKGTISALIKLFRENILHIYRALLQEQRIVVFGEKITTAQICQVVYGCMALVRPLNICDKVYPIEHIQSISLFDDMDSYVLGFSNPMIKNQSYYKWDMLIDIKEKKVYGGDGEVLTKSNLGYLDKKLASSLVTKLMQETFYEVDLARIFGEFTKQNIELFLNRGGKINPENEQPETLRYLSEQSDIFKRTTFYTAIDLYYKNERERFKEVFGGDYLQVYQSFKYLSENEDYDDLELMMSYSSLKDGLSIPQQISFFLARLQSRVGSLDSITAGFMCGEIETRLAAAELVCSIEKNPCWQAYMNEASLFKVLLVNDGLILAKTSKIDN